MNSSYVCYNNKFYAEDQPLLGVNRAMKFGDGVFESIRVINGESKYLPFHLERMRKGLDKLEITYSKGDLSILEVLIEQTLVKNEIEESGIVRVIAHRSGLGKYEPETNQVIFYIEVERLRERSYQLNEKGLNLGLANKIKIDLHYFSGLKTLNALPYVIAAKERANAKEDELVLLNSKNEIVEASSSNIFLVIGNKVITPSLDSGCLDGIMRRVIINKLKSKHFEVEIRNVLLQELDQANEVFISNAITGIQWIASYKKKRFFKKVSNMLIDEL